MWLSLVVSMGGGNHLPSGNCSLAPIYHKKYRQFESQLLIILLKMHTWPCMYICDHVCTLSDLVSSLRTQLNWLLIRLRRKLRALSVLYLLYLNSPSSPKYLNSYFHFLCSNYDRNPLITDTWDRQRRRRFLLRCLSHISVFVGSSFVVQSVILWNELPQYV